MANAPTSPSSNEPGSLDVLSDFISWCRQNPVPAFLFAAVVATLGYFFFWLPLFNVNDSQTVAKWAWLAWNPEGNQEHSKLVPLIFLGLIYYHRQEIRNAVKQGSNKGIIFVVIGVLLYVLAVRCKQPRMALTAVPFLLYGMTYYLWGTKVARVVLFPCAFLIFMIPMGAVEQATNNLQFIVTGAVTAMSNLVGIKIQAVGTTMTAADGSFNFEIAEGCSGIRSITAMAMLTAVYVHLTQDALWKKIVIFVGSAVFAVIGNFGRIFTVILVARFYDPKFAGGIYHDYSGFVFFPFALLAMVGFSKLVNLDFGEITDQAKRIESDPDKKKKGGTPTTYDY